MAASVHLRNQHFQADFSARGAELVRLIRVRDGADLLWNGDPVHWSGRAPLLFPVVGALHDGSYVWQGRRYTLERHGFAHRSDFDLMHQDEDSATFLLSGAGLFLESFPQEFELAVTWTLLGPRLTLRLDLLNPSRRDDLLASVGWHPAFRWPLQPGIDPASYRLEFPAPATCDRLEVNTDGLLTGKRIPFFRDQPNLRLREDLFRAGAVVLDRPGIDRVSLVADDDPGIAIETGGAPHLALWSCPGAPFMCIEPWHGLPDRADADWDLRAKPGILQIPPGETWSWEVSVLDLG